MLSQKDYNILRLFRSKNVGPTTFIKLLNFFGDCETALNNIEEYNKKSKSKHPIIIATKEEIDKEIVSCSTIGAKIITYQNENYPNLLKQIEIFPAVLTCLGNLELFKKRSISIIGSRTASSNGCNFARKLAKELGESGYAITSGFASGIDTSAHKGSINTGTIAVLGGGIDDIYPRGNEDLYYEIKNKGLIITELTFGCPPRAENFPNRNRIVSGLSEAVIVIEAGARSGTIHTARQAIEQGRELLVAPGNPYDYRCEGSNKLIKDGANVITSTEDVLDILDNFKINNISNNSFNLNDNHISINNDYFINQINKDIEEEKKLNEEYNENFENELEEEKEQTLEEIILSKLNYTPISPDLLCEDLGIKINILNSKLVELELEDKIVIENGMIRLK